MMGDKYLLLTEFEGRTGSYGLSVFPFDFGPSVKCVGHKSMGKKQGSVTYSTDRENEVSTDVYRILHGKSARTVFTHELWRIRNRTSERSERVIFLIQNNECVNTVQSTFHVVLCLLYTY